MYIRLLSAFLFVPFIAKFLKSVRLVCKLYLRRIYF